MKAVRVSALNNQPGQGYLNLKLKLEVEMELEVELKLQTSGARGDLVEQPLRCLETKGRANLRAMRVGMGSGKRLRLNANANETGEAFGGGLARID